MANVKTAAPDLTEDRILRVAAAMDKLGAGCRQTLYGWVAKGILTPPIKIGLRASGWRESTLNEFIRQREAGSGNA